MYSTKAAAEKAALQGEVQDWDTQQCRDLQEEILSSSPQAPANAVASNVDTVIDQVLPAQWASNDAGEAEGAGVGKGTGRTEQEDDGANSRVHLEDLDDADLDGRAQQQRSQVYYRCDRHSRIRPFNDKGKEHHITESVRKHWAEFRTLNAMDDLTQKSSMSPTQENSASVYAQFDIQTIVNVGYSSGDSHDEDSTVQALQAANSLPSKHQSLVTDSTAHTYGENDTGHIKLDFNPEPCELDEPESQDSSYAIQQVDEHLGGPSYEPQTPAPPINPFSQKGSVMKGHELFGATQPSSMARHFASPTSSRPSPDVYNDFTSPLQRRLASSPLVRGPGVEEISPLQSSVRHILTNRAVSVDSPQVNIPRTPGIQSFNQGPTMLQSSLVRGPRAYTSMKDSQERRRMALNLNLQESDSESSDSSIEPVAKRRKKDIDQDIQRQLSAVELRRRMPPSSRPQSSSSAVVEVPSTSIGRRRSFEEEYLAQCDGSDARDTQQDDDIIADSQSLPNHERSEPTAAADTNQDAAHPEAETKPMDGMDLTAASPKPSTQLNAEGIELESALGPNQQQETSIHSHPDPSENQFPRPTLPLQELFSNHDNLRTPTASKKHLLSDGPDATVPETSPAEDRIRPMGEVASFSNPREDDSLQDVPGFTQDVDFDNAIATGIEHPLESPWTGVPEENATSKTNSKPAAPEDTANVPEKRSAKGSSVLPGVASVVVNELETPFKDKRRNGDENAPPTSRTDEMLTAPEPEDDEIIQAISNKDEASTEIIDNVEAAADPPSTVKRGGLRSKAKIKGPSSAMRRTGTTSTPKSVPQQSGRISKGSSTAKPSTSQSVKPLADTPSASSSSSSVSQLPDTVPNAKPSNKRSSTRKSGLSTAAVEEQTPEHAPTKRTSKRKPGPVAVDSMEEAPAPTRSSKRQSIAQSTKESSEDPLAFSVVVTSSESKHKGAKGLFSQMAFAVSYVGHEQDKNHATKLIIDNGGQILQEGFDCLFEIVQQTRAKAAADETKLALSPIAKSIGFASLIADEHSRKAKYMQALALGLPCISGQWISSCVSKGMVVDWSPYLLCAGRSSVLGNACRSRILQPYPAADANLVDTFESRDKLLSGKSILLVIGKGKTDSRKAYVFLTRALGPTRVGQVADLAEARRTLVEAEKHGQNWDLLYVDAQEEAAETAVFGPPAAVTGGGSRKRKRGATATADETPAPKRIRVINDEVIVQSLILGQLLED